MAAEKQGTNCLLTALDTPRFLRLHKAARDSVGPQESSSW